MAISKKVKVHSALIAVWAALMATAGLLPTFPVFGTGGSFSVGYALAPLAGIMFGPFAGALSVGIGEFIGSIIAPHAAPIGLFTFTINTVNAFCAGFICRKKWWVPAIVILLETALWFTLPQARELLVFSLIYLVGLIMVPIGGIFGKKIFNHKNLALKAVGIFLMVWPCYIAGSIIGNFFTLILYETPSDLWNTFLVFMVPFERSVFAIGAAIIGVPLLIGLPKIGIFVGPEFDEAEVEDDLDAKMQAKRMNK